MAPVRVEVLRQAVQAAFTAQFEVPRPVRRRVVEVHFGAELRRDGEELAVVFKPLLVAFGNAVYVPVRSGNQADGVQATWQRTGDDVGEGAARREPVGVAAHGTRRGSGRLRRARQARRP